MATKRELIELFHSLAKTAGASQQEFALAALE